jgi:hypothetical protein
MEDFKEQYARFFCHSRFGSLRRLIKRTQRNRVSHRFGHTSILQDGARTFSTIAVLGLVRARQDMRHLSFVNAILAKAPPFQNKPRRTGHPKVRIGGWATRRMARPVN